MRSRNKQFTVTVDGVEARLMRSTHGGNFTGYYVALPGVPWNKKVHVFQSTPEKAVQRAITRQNENRENEK